MIQRHKRVIRSGCEQLKISSRFWPGLALKNPDSRRQWMDFGESLASPFSWRTRNYFLHVPVSFFGEHLSYYLDAPVEDSLAAPAGTVCTCSLAGPGAFSSARVPGVGC